MNRLLLLLTLAGALAFASCSHRGSGDKVVLTRLDQLMFTTDPAQLPKALRAHAADYDTRLLNVAPYDPMAMQMLTDFAADPGMRYVFRVADSLYHDLDWLALDLGRALSAAGKQMPSIRYRHFYTLLTGDFDDYRKRVFADSIDLAISLDHYSVGHLGNVVPAYIERLCRKEYIVADCLGAIASAYIPPLPPTPTLLDHAIREGKKLYFTKKCLPRTDDTILLHYSPDQLRWAQTYIGNVWSTLVAEKLLYSRDYNRFHNMVDEAPMTNAFGTGSAPRLPAYIGLQIVDRYMKQTGSTMQELFANTDSQRILSASGWRP